MSGHAVVPDGGVVATAVATVFLAVFYTYYLVQVLLAGCLYTTLIGAMSASSLHERRRGMH